MNDGRVHPRSYLGPVASRVRAFFVLDPPRAGQNESTLPVAAIMDLLDRLKAFFRLGVLPPALRRLDGRSKALLAASFKMLPDEEPGWITMKEAAAPFSPERDAYAFGELDEIGKANLAAFASASEGQFDDKKSHRDLGHRPRHNRSRR